MTASRFAAYADARLLQAPVHHRVSRLPPAINYAETLNRVGYLDVDVLFSLIEAWRGLLRLVGPDLVLADHSPTALIAARLEKMPPAAIGSGFFAPPRVSPIPGIQPWRDIPEETLVKSEAAVVRRINQVIDRHGGEKLEQLSDMFDLADNFLTILPEFDHYDRPAQVGHSAPEYCGPLDMPVESGDVPWPAGEGDRVFVYFRTGYPHFKTMIRQ